MDKQNTVPKAPVSVQSEKYDSNPFTLSFKAFGKFFETNKGWGIALIVLGILDGIGRTIANFFQQIAETPDRSKPMSSSGFSFSNIDLTVILAVVIVAVVIIIVMIIVSALVDALVKGMLSYVALQSEKGISVSLSEAFNQAGKRFGRLFWAILLANLKIFGWSLLLIIPGVIASFRYKLLPYVIMDEPSSEKGVGDSHTKTKALVKGRLLEIFGVSTVAAIIPFVGSILALAGGAGIYSQLQATSSNPESRPKTHWLNYLGFVLALLAILFISLIIFLIYLAISNA